MGNLTSDNVNQLVKKQLDTIEDALVHATITSLLVKPFAQSRQWDYGTEKHLCWVVAEDSTNNTRYVYCEHGFGPKLPWGIVSVSGLEMGMDSNWFESLESAFYDSWAGSEIRIWNVVKRNTTGDDRIVANNLTVSEADALIKKLNAEEDNQLDSRGLYCWEPRTKVWW